MRWHHEQEQLIDCKSKGVMGVLDDWPCIDAFSGSGPYRFVYRMGNLTSGTRIDSFVELDEPAN